MAKSNKTQNKSSESSKHVDEVVSEVREIRDALGTGLTIPELTKALRSLHSIADEEKLDTKYQEECSAQQVKCLKEALQAAVTLEFATIPPYLSALWSIKDELHPVTKSIREVVQEEMLHMALACNMLASLGETPQIASTVPQYPASLPGGVHKGLTVTLMGLSKESLQGFLWIERPLTQVPIENPYGKENAGFDLDELDRQHPRDETIGEFYEQISKGFETYLANAENPPLKPLSTYIVGKF